MWNRIGSITRRMAIKLGTVLLGLTLAGAVHAQTCTYAADNPYGNGPFNAVVPLNITALTIGRDVPDGTVLYRQTIATQGSYRVYCPAAVTSTTTNRWLPVTPRPLSSWNSGTYAGKTYETGVPGIGVAVFWASQVYPVKSAGSNTGNLTYTLPSQFDYVVIKTGPVSPGVISGANLPTAQYDFGATGSELTVANTRFTGSLRIVSQTCTTPDVTVDLGTYKVSDFKGAGSVTPFKNFNIQLQNCPAFYGRSASLTNTDSATGWVESGRTINPNVLAFSLTPTTDIISAYPGTVGLSPTSSGPPAATGIGVQVATRIIYAPFNTLIGSGITPTAVDGASYSIPLQAHYIQTGAAAPTPGPANTSMMFTINYQ